MRNGAIDTLASSNKMASIFGSNMKNGMVHIDWFSGNLNFPTSNEVLRWDGVFNTIYERERVLNILNGVVMKVTDVENYEQVPNGLDRKDKKEISDLLFKKLKKLKWKNDDDFDCSEKYFVTIDKKGLISKVRMFFTAEEIEKYYEEDEYNYCINKVFGGLESLQFDIIKEKGIPISEDVYLEIWVKNNWRLENWTD